MAESLNVSPRTLRVWKALDPAAARRRPGRPRVPAEERCAVKERVRRVLDEQGWSAGERTVAHVLDGVPLARVRVALRELKREKEARATANRSRNRTSTRVLLGDAIWAMDATHVGRDVDGHEILAEVVREVHSTRTIGLSVGHAATEDDVIALLEQVWSERRTLPLVLLTDNGGQYTGAKLAAWCAAHRVVHLFSLPRTPQHNPAAEHGMRELKEVSALGKGVVTTSHDALMQLDAALVTVDHHRLRATRDWKTAVQADAESLPWHAVIDRRAFYRDVTCAIREAVKGSTNRRAQRRAVREAILCTLERHRAIHRTRGGPPRAAN